MQLSTSVHHLLVTMVAFARTLLMATRVSVLLVLMAKTVRMKTMSAPTTLVPRAPHVSIRLDLDILVLRSTRPHTHTHTN